jgi:hypothetical protein
MRPLGTISALAVVLALLVLAVLSEVMSAPHLLPPVIGP